MCVSETLCESPLKAANDRLLGLRCLVEERIMVWIIPNREVRLQAFNMFLHLFRVTLPCMFGI